MPDRNVISRRHCLAAAGMGVATALSSALLPPGRAFGTTLHRAVLTEYRRRGDRDDTAALLRAAADKKTVFVPAGNYSIGMTDADDLPSGFALIGEGARRSVILRSFARRTSFVLHADSRSKDLAKNLVGLTIEGLSFVDQGSDRSYSPFAYLLCLSGLTGARIRACAFRGFRGDAIYLGSSTVRANERHNLDVAIEDCMFDGINGNTRNAISVLDCRKLLIKGCQFKSVGRSGGKGPMSIHDPHSGFGGPGAIAIEPERTGFAVVDEVDIADNTFVGGGGNAVTLNLFRNGRDGLARNITVRGNTVTDRDGGFGVSAEIGGASQAVHFERNDIRRCRKAFLIDGVNGLTMSSNTFRDCSEHAELGWRASVEDVAVVGNTFERVGSQTGYALWIRRGSELRIERNRFVETKTALAFVAGTTQHAIVQSNRFEDSLGSERTMLAVFAGAKIDRRTLTLRDNLLTKGGSIVAQADLGPQ